jgi:hypothetical protein
VCGATAYTQFATWAAVEYLARCVATRTREAGEASIQSVGNKQESRGCRVKRKTLRGPSGKKKCWRCEPLSFAYFSLRRRNYSALVNCYQAMHSEGHDEDARHQGPDTGAEGRTHR